jgi:hypothetical protein
MGCLIGFFSLIINLIWWIVKFIIQVAIGACIIYVGFEVANFVFALDLLMTKEIALGFSTVVVVMTKILFLSKP